MAASLPHGHRSLVDAYNAPAATLVNVMGVAVDAMPPGLTKNGQWTMNFTLHDIFSIVDVNLPQGLKARFFKPQQGELPNVEIGDVVILKDIKVMDNSGMRVLVANWATSSVVFPAASIPEPNFQISVAGGKHSIECRCLPVNKRPDIAEQIHAMTLKAKVGPDYFQSPPIARPTVELPPQNPADPGQIVGAEFGQVTSPTATFNGGQQFPRNRKFSLIQDTRPPAFHDIVVEVVKIFPSPYSGLCEVYVTDYTSHSQLFHYDAPGEDGRDGDNMGYITTSKREWSGPWGQTVLKIELHEPHASFVARSVKERDVIELRNVRMKLGRDGKLEANLYPDNRMRDKVLVFHIRGSSSIEKQNLLDRSENYWMTMKRPKDGRLNGQEDSEKPLSKQQKKKKAKKMKNQSDGDKLRITDDASNRVLKDVVVTNKHVHCANGSVILSTVSEMICADRNYTDFLRNEHTLPFINQKRRSKVRVVDFYPHSLKDFAIQGRTRRDDPGSDVDMDDYSTPSWEWDFFLLVEDAKVARSATNQRKLWLHVPNLPAQYLMKLDAADLQNDQATLNQLREKLCILWGNLEELKSEKPLGDRYGAPVDDRDNVVDPWDGALTNVPFECCIFEYGQEHDADDSEDEELGGWTRLYELFGTTIM